MTKVVPTQSRKFSTGLGDGGDSLVEVGALGETDEIVDVGADLLRAVAL